MTTLAKALRLSPQVSQALAEVQPVVALESTVITHGLPYPQNLEIAIELEETIRALGAQPATIAVLDGFVHVGVTPKDLERLAQGAQHPQKAMRKISRRDLAPAIALGWSGGTTVAATLLIAHAAGLRVFATGGIGGVHHSPPFDLSADLPELARNPLVVVCAGAKAILNLAATLEVLETLGVPVIGYRTDEFPAFYTVSSGLKLSLRADSPTEIARIAGVHWSLPDAGAVLVANPPPAESALAPEVVERAIAEALKEAEQAGMRGQNLTPFLLERVNALTSGASLEANLALLKNNAQLAAQIALALKQNEG